MHIKIVYWSNSNHEIIKGQKIRPRRKNSKNIFYYYNKNGTQEMLHITCNLPKGKMTSRVKYYFKYFLYNFLRQMTDRLVKKKPLLSCETPPIFPRGKMFTIAIIYERICHLPQETTHICLASFVCFVYVYNILYIYMYVFLKQFVLSRV